MSRVRKHHFPFHKEEIAIVLGGALEFSLQILFERRPGEVLSAPPELDQFGAIDDATVPGIGIGRE
jgi:hypothetical protein